MDIDDEVAQQGGVDCLELLRKFDEDDENFSTHVQEIGADPERAKGVIVCFGAVVSTLIDMGKLFELPIDVLVKEMLNAAAQGIADANRAMDQEDAGGDVD
jgi:hypothetical protein